VGEWGAVCLVLPAVLALLCFLGAYFLVGVSGWRRRTNYDDKTRAEIMCQAFKTQLDRGKITKEQYENILRKYSGK
jgi:uncharacterized membrane protein